VAELKQLNGVYAPSVVQFCKDAGAIPNSMAVGVLQVNNPAGITFLTFQVKPVVG